MYIPAKYVSKDVDELVRCVREYPFALIITGQEHLTWAPIQLVQNGPDYFFEFHLARQNPHAVYLSKTSSQQQAETVIAFLGPHGYISPRWFADRAQNVPTWNFTAFHVKGRPVEVSENKPLFDLLDRLVTANEDTMKHAKGTTWTMRETKPPYVELLSNGIIGFRMKMESFEGKTKLSQDFSVEDRKTMIAGLRDVGNGALADSMQRALAKEKPVSKL